MWNKNKMHKIFVMRKLEDESTNCKVKWVTLLNLLYITFFNSWQVQKEKNL